MAQQNGGQFDPVLFGDYRDPSENIFDSLGDDFFTDAYPVRDFSTPYNTGNSAPVEPKHKQDLINEVESKTMGMEDRVASGEQGKILDCSETWFVAFPSLCIHLAHIFQGTGSFFRGVPVR